MCIYTNICKVGKEMWVLIRLYIHALSHFFFGVGFESALDPERPFSVLSIPDEVTRHSLLQGGGEEKQKKLKLNRGSSKNLLRFSSSRRSHCWYTLRWSWKLTFSPQAWQEQREWSSWATWSPLAMRCLRPHMRLWWWPACCPPPSLQTATTNKKDDDDGNIQTVTADVREKQTFIYHVREPWLHFELFKKAFLLRQVGRWTAG